MADALPDGEPGSIKLVGAYRNTMNSFTGKGTTETVSSVFEYTFGEKLFLFSMTIKDHDGVKTIVGFHVDPENQSLQQQHRFTLVGKSVFQYFVLATCIAGVTLTLYALVVCIRTKPLPRKWLWIVFIIFGLGKVAVNWSTGQWGVQPLSLQLFSASAFAPFYGPWTIAFSLPVGAIVFLARRRTAMGQTPTQGL